MQRGLCALNIGQRCDLGQRGTNVAFLGNMGHESHLHFARLIVAGLGHVEQAHIVPCEHACHSSHNARTIGHVEANVVLALQIVDGNQRQVVGAGAANNRADAHGNATATSRTSPMTALAAGPEPAPGP